MIDEQKLVDVIRNIVRQEVRNGARLHIVDGFIHDASSYTLSAYLNGDEEELITDIIPMTGMYAAAGSYVQVTANESGWTWVSRLKENALYSKIAIDPNNGRLLLGNGTVPPSAGSYGQTIYSGGPSGSAYWK